MTALARFEKSSATYLGPLSDGLEFSGGRISGTPSVAVPPLDPAKTFGPIGIAVKNGALPLRQPSAPAIIVSEPPLLNLTFNVEPGPARLDLRPSVRVPLFGLLADTGEAGVTNPSVSFLVTLTLTGARTSYDLESVVVGGQFSSTRIEGKNSSDPLDAYASLGCPNWDGYGAEPLTPATLSYARKVIKSLPNVLGPPDIAPSVDGSIALEWVPESGPVHKLFLDIGPGEKWRAYWRRRGGEFGRLPWEGPVTTSMKDALRAMFNDLSQ